MVVSPRSLSRPVSLEEGRLKVQELSPPVRRVPPRPLFKARPGRSSGLTGQSLPSGPDVDHLLRCTHDGTCAGLYSFLVLLLLPLHLRRATTPLLPVLLCLRRIPFDFLVSSLVLPDWYLPSLPFCPTIPWTEPRTSLTVTDHPWKRNGV